MGTEPLAPPPDVRWVDTEWLEADGRGGFASGTVAGMRTRRYHALLLTATAPPAGRVVLVNGFEAWLDTTAGTIPLSTQHYGPDVTFPRGFDHLVAFHADPWPTWRFRTPDGTSVEHECVIGHGDGTVVLRWRLRSPMAKVRLRVRPLLSGRDFHTLMRENDAFDFTARAAAGNVGWRPYPVWPAIRALSNGTYAHEPLWYRNFLYVREAERGLDCHEDLASPGTFEFDLGAGDALLVLSADHVYEADAGTPAMQGQSVDATTVATRVFTGERARRQACDLLGRAAESYLVRHRDAHSVIAGYPWFCEWGRDTFIALRGVAIARGQSEVAGAILDTWSATVSEGMLPNRLPERGGAAEYNAVDASLWYVVAVHAYLAVAAPVAGLRARLLAAVEAILQGYTRGTRFGIRVDGDGLLACGVPGVQLTWMDARVDGRVITPRIGKPVEVQALWINALRLSGDRYAAMADQALATFRARFWNTQRQCLYDVIDADHVGGRVEASVRPNQIFAVGGLPFALMDGMQAKAIVDVVERDLVTPMGLRSLAPMDPAYHGRYEGDGRQRDEAYHQGTVWPWLAGAFVDAWLRVHGDDAGHRAQARQRFLAPLIAHLAVAGLGHVSEIADGDPPHTPRGCPFQAWSVGELIRALARTAPCA